jgi:hypothetical protein
MTFKLVHKSTNAALATYHITDGRGDIVGSVNVKPDEVADLLKCWRGAVPAAAATAGKQARAANAISAALKRGPRMNKAAILRGC